MSTQSPSISVIQSPAQPSYSRTEPGRKVLTPKGRITIFAELTDKLAEACGHIRLVAKQAPQTFPYLSPNGLIMLCVNLQFTHVYAHAKGCPSCVYSLLSSVPRSILSVIGIDRMRQENAGARQTYDRSPQPMHIGWYSRGTFVP